MRPPILASELERLVGTELGVSGWLLVDQPMIDVFADVTKDRQFIHVEPARAASTPFGGTIAHGFLTLSLLSHFAEECVPLVEGAAMSINYGFDQVRFLSPVPSGSRVRARFLLKDSVWRSASQIQNRYAATVEIEGSDRPALAAEWLTLIVLPSAGKKDDIASRSIDPRTAAEGDPRGRA